MGPHDVDEIIAELGLEAHPEGGWYVETWRDAPEDGARGVGTAIYYLLRAGERSRKHRIDAAEIWHHYAGDPIRLVLQADGGSPEELTLGPNVARGERPQILVPPGVWQSAEPLGSWALMGCTASPAFQFEGFEFADA